MANRIKEFRQKKGWSQGDLAAQLGVGWQAVSRAENDAISLTPAKRRRFAEALGVDEDTLFQPAPMRRVRIVGYVQAGSWAETWELPEDDQYDVPVPYDEELGRYTLYGAETRGPSMNKRYPEGTALIFTDAIETHEDLVLGKRYIVERQRADGLREATVKTLWRDDNERLWLLPESTDPMHQAPIAIDGDEDDLVRIVGRVRYAVSRE